MKKYKAKKIDGKSEPKMVGEFIDGIIQASNACNALVHHLRDPRFMDVRITLDLTISLARKLATTSLRYGSAEIKTTIGYRKPEATPTPNKIVL